MRDLTGDQWAAALPELLNDFQQLLLDVTGGLQRELGEADDHNDFDPTGTCHPSLRTGRTGAFCDWVTLIELVRDAWLCRLPKRPRTCPAGIAPGLVRYTFTDIQAIGAHSPLVRKTSFVQTSGSNGYFRTTLGGLWSLGTRRETLRLLVLPGPPSNLPPAKEWLESAILAGPPRKMYRDDLMPEQWSGLVERSIWLNLATKLNASGVGLGISAASRLEGLSKAHPLWKLAA